MNESAPIESTSDSGSKISARNRSFFVILMVSLVVALISYAVQQYGLNKDLAAGAEKRKHDETEQAGNSETSDAEKKYLEQQQFLAKSLGDSLARNPKDTSLLLPLSSARIATGDTLGALQLLERYVKTVNPNNVAAQTDYAYLMFISGRVQEGIDLTAKVLSHEPKNQIALFNMAVMCYKQGKMTDAIRWMQRCETADTSSTLGNMAQRALVELQSEVAQAQGTGKPSGSKPGMK